MSKKKRTKRDRALAARLGHRRREERELQRDPAMRGKIDRLVMALASNQVTIAARLVTLQRLRLEDRPPEDGEALCQWLADYEQLWEEYPNLTQDDALWPPEVCKAINEGRLQDLHDRAAEMGATVSFADKTRCSRSGEGWRDG